MKPSKNSRMSTQRCLSKAYTSSLAAAFNSAAFRVTNVVHGEGNREYYNVWVNSDALHRQQQLMIAQHEALVDLEEDLREKIEEAELMASQLREKMTQLCEQDETLVASVDLSIQNRRSQGPQALSMAEKNS